MDEPKKEPIPLNQRQDYKVCLNCGFPNRNDDSQCMYCDTSLIEDNGLVSWLRQTYYILRWRRQLKQKKEKAFRRPSTGMSNLKKAGFLVLGLLLTGIGSYFLTVAVSTSSFSKAIIAVLFLFYGIFTFRSLYTKGR
ncbi:MAG: hypothetical protein ACE5EK_01025 [Nitrospinales bacterium]